MSSVVQMPARGGAPNVHMPQYSIEAESAVLGGLLLQCETAWDRVGDLLHDGDFYRREHRLIYAAIGQLVNANRSADVITVFEQLQRSGEDQEAGGLTYLNSLAQYVPSAANIRRYAEIVRERSMLRSLAAAGERIVASTVNTEGKSVDVLQDEAEALILTIGDEASRLKGGAQHIDGLVVQVLDHIQERADNPDAMLGTPSGFADFDRMTLGLQDGDLLVLAARPSMGKAQPLDANVLTTSGWKAMGALTVGDSLVSDDGKPSEVTGIFPQGSRQVYRITFSDGRDAECCAEHLWRVMYRTWPQPRVVETTELMRMLECKRYRNRLWIEPVVARFGHGRALPIDPWVLGALLGDGSIGSTSVRFSNVCEETLQRMRARLGEELELSHDNRCSYRIVQSSRGHEAGHYGMTPNPLAEKLRALGLWGLHSHEKFIPPEYLGASLDERLELLRGLLDTDGWAEKWGSIRISTASARLAQDIASLVRSVGGFCSITSKQPHFSGADGRRRAGRAAWVCNIAHQDPRSLFAMSSKQLRAPATWQRQRRLTIASITPTRITECQCIAVSHNSRLYVTDNFVTTHNTAMALNIAEHVAVHEGLPVAVFSMEMGATQLTVRMIGSLGRIDQQRLRTGKLTDEEWPRLTEAIERLRPVQLMIDETPGMTVSEVRSEARRLARAHGKLGLIVVDYLQLMTISREMAGENRATAIGEISRGLKLLAKELHCPVVALSQLSRAVESRTDKRPMMSDLRESGAIEQDADVIMFIYRDEYYNKDSKEPGVAELIISKQRNGPTGTMKLAWVSTLTRFENLAQQY